MDVDLVLSATSTTLPVRTAQVVATNDQSSIERAMIPYKIELHSAFRESAPFVSN